MRANRDHGSRCAPPVATRLGPTGAKMFTAFKTRVFRGQAAVQQTSKAPVNGYRDYYLFYHS